MIAKIPALVWQAVGIVVLFFALMFGKGCYDERIIRNAKENAAVDSGTANIAEAKGTLVIRDSVVVQDRIRWVDVARGATASRPNDPVVANLVRSCDQVLSSCTNQRRAAQAVIDSQDVQIKRLERMKAMTPPRLSFFGEVLRDVPNKEWLTRAGVNFRVVGPIEITAVAELAPRDSKARALAGLRYTFR